MATRISKLAAAGALTGAEQVEVTQLSTTVTITAATISALASDNSYNDSGSGFVAAGFAVGQTVRVTGFTGNVANNIYSAKITALTTDKMTIGGTDGDVIVDDAAGESVTITKWDSKRATYGESASDAADVTFTPTTGGDWDTPPDDVAEALDELADRLTDAELSTGNVSAYVTFPIAVGDETTPLTTGTSKIAFRVPYAMSNVTVRASVTNAPTGANLVVDINEDTGGGATSILSTKLSIDAGEKTSTTAATPAVVSDASLANDAEITIDIDQVGSTIAGSGLKVYITGTIAAQNSINGGYIGVKGTDIASAGTTDLAAATGDFVDVTGTTTITALGTIGAGVERLVRFTGILTLTHHATSLILPTGANITTAAGDTARFRSLGAGNWACVSYQRKDGTALAGSGGGGGGDSTTTAAYASKPAASNDGNLFLPSDGFQIERDTGSVWAPWGPIYPLTLPVDGDFAWVNQGTGSVTTTQGGIHLLAPAASGTNIRARVKSAPATPYVITACFLPLLTAINFASCGLLFRQSSDGKIAVLGLAHSTDWEFSFNKYSSATAFASQYGIASMKHYLSPIFLRIADNGTNRILSFGTDGQNFTQLHSVGRTDYLTADQVGFYANSENTTYPAAATLLSWKQS